MKLEIEKVNMIDEIEWSKFVEETYKRPYNFQQQNGCQDRGTFHLTVPHVGEDYKNDTVPEVVNHEEIGVSFKAWLERDPKTPLDGNGDEKKKEDSSTYINMWWERNFYPDIQMIANDLHSKGLLDAGEYVINIDW
jgi:hypothetical protein